MSEPRASVIVCTRNRAVLLADTLASLAADTSATTRELIVVDNASTDDTGDVVRRAMETAQFPVHLVSEPRLGHSNARNAGVAAANGEFLLFTDDDVVVQDGWVDELVAAFNDERVGAAGGRILPDWPEPPPRWLQGPHARLLTLEDYGEHDRPFTQDEYVIGANMAVRAGIARSFDPPFDPRLGHAGAQRMGHEEVHFMNRVRETHEVVYRARAVVHHRVDHARMNLPFMRRTFLELGIGLGRRERIEGAEHLRLPVRLVRAWRTSVGARRAALQNDRAERDGTETWNELYGLMWAGKHLEMLLGRFPRLTDRVAKIVTRTL